MRRDLTGFQHVHPTLDGATGVWRTDVDLSPGAWRVLADFRPTGAEPLVLGTDLLVSGSSRRDPLGEDRLDAHVDGYDVNLGGSFKADGETVLTVTVSRDGQPVTDLRALPRLLRPPGLAARRRPRLSARPPRRGQPAPGPAVAFHTEFPSAGRYRLFLDFRHGGAVRTAAFTVTVDGAGHAGPTWGGQP